MKYLGINLTKEVKDIYSENSKTLMKEFGNNTKKWKYFIIIFFKQLFCVSVISFLFFFLLMVLIKSFLLKQN